MKIEFLYSIHCIAQMGKYKPVSCIIEIENAKAFNNDPDFLQTKSY